MAAAAPLRMKSDVSSRVTPSATLALTLWASTESPAMRARPIISAPAVLAVRRGTRKAFSRASLATTLGRQGPRLVGPFGPDNRVASRSGSDPCRGMGLTHVIGCSAWA